MNAKSCRHSFHRPTRAVLLALLAVSVGSPAHAGEPITASRSGDELVVRLDRFDQLRQSHKVLNATLTVRGAGQVREIKIDLTDAAVHGALVLDLTRFGRCDGIAVRVTDGGGKVVAEKTISPVPELVIRSHLPPAKAGAETYAYIEPGTDTRKGTGPAPAGKETAVPRIPLPEVGRLREVRLAPPDRTVAKKEITFPVVADTDFPLAGGSVVGRQTAAPKDPARASLYFTYKKGIYDGSTLSRWQKFLVEVPIQNSWGSGTGDATVVLAPDQFEVHVTNETAPGGRNMLGAGDGDLGQKGEIDADDEGRIYWRVEGGGAYVVRFNPHTKTFEQPPTRIDFQKLVPAGIGLLNDNLCKVTCTRGRVYFTMCNDSLVTGDPGNAHRRRLGGVFSIPQDWSDAAAFEKDVRLHVGSWESARPTLYPAAPKADADVRKLGGCSATEAGLFITTAAPKYEGGPWRLDLDGNGRTKYFGQVKSLDATVGADGTPLAATRLVEIKGVPKGRELNPGTGAGRGLIAFSQAEITIPRASVRLLVHGEAGVSLRRAAKHAFPTYDGAPAGIVKVSYDLVGKLKTAPAARGALANSLSGGSSLGPAFLVTPIPGVADRAAAVCEYTGYPLSVLDFSTIPLKKSVGKSFLPASAPTQLGVGPYTSAWVTQAGEEWLYIGGYTGLARVKYSQDGKPVGDAGSDVFNTRLVAAATDGHRRTSMKKIDGLLPVFGGRLLDSGYGIGDRGGDALSTGVELFDPRALGSGRTQTAPSQTAAYLSRCFALKTLRGRMVWDAADGSPRQQIYAASGSVRKQLITDLGDKDQALAPGNLDAKIFCYEVGDGTGLRDRYGFSLPRSAGGTAVEGHIALSPCQRFLVILTQEGALYSFDIGRKQFIDGLVLRKPSGDPVQLMEFHRPSEILLAAPNGQLFFFTAPFDVAGSADFNQVSIDDTGRLGVRPHLGITFDSPDGAKDFGRVVRCFMPDLKAKDGSYDLVLGYSQSTVTPFVRVIHDFIPPGGPKR